MTGQRRHHAPVAELGEDAGAPAGQGGEEARRQVPRRVDGEPAVVAQADTDAEDGHPDGERDQLALQVQVTPVRDGGDAE